MKRCKSCQVIKDALSFSKHPNTKDRLGIYCRVCCAEKSRMSRLKPEYLEKYRLYLKARRLADPGLKAAHRRKNRYGLSKETYNLLWNVQEESCAICGKQVASQWHTDHDHATGKVRGILCGHCNLMLGHAKDRVETLKRAITYLGG